MRVLIVSDTHGRNDNLYKAVQNEKDLSFMVHLGDLCGLEDYIEETTGIPCYAVRGNNDYASLLPAESLIMLGKHKTLILHGHNHGVYYSTRELKHYARALGCDIVMYGTLNSHPSSAIQFIKEKRTDYAMFYQELIDNVL